MQPELTFTTWLKQKRREQGLTQETLAGLAGCSTAYLKMIEAGRRPPTRPVVDALLEALQVPKEMRAIYVDLAFASRSSPPASVPLPSLIEGRTELVGRQRELAQLRQEWARVKEGRTRIALLSGEPGIGKTRLAHELIAEAARDGASILRGGCYEYEATTPYLPFVEALRAYVRAQPASVLRQRLGPTAPEIARLAPELDAKIGPLTPNPALSPEDERLRLFDNVGRFLASLAGERGLLLFIDDLHWADGATIALLRYLLRNLPADRIFVLATYREDEIGRSHPLADALVTWHRDRIATRLPLSRLSGDETAALLATLFHQATVSDEFAEAIFQETEGNPFFTEEVVKSLIETGQVYREGEGWGRRAVAELAIPPSIREAIGRRFTRLSKPCVETLCSAAALGKTFHFYELAAVSPASEEELLDTLDEASTAQVIRSVTADGFTFTHDKIRETLLEELNPIRRRRLHGRIGEGLEKLYAAQAVNHAATLAYHFVESNDWQRALAYSSQAAENAERVFAQEEAIEYLALARKSAVALGDPQTEAIICEQLGDLYYGGKATLAVENYLTALELTQSTAKRAVLKSRIGAVCAQIGDRRGEEFLEAALHELDPETQGGELARAMAHLGRFRHYRGQHRQAIALLEQAHALVEPLDDVATLVFIFFYLAGNYVQMACYKESGVYARRDLHLGELHDSPVATLHALMYLGENARLMGDWPKGLDYLAQQRSLAQKLGSERVLAWGFFTEAEIQHALGNLVAAHSEARDAHDRVRQIDDLRGVTHFGYLRAMIETDLGLDESASTHIEKALAAASTADHIYPYCLARWAAAYFHVQLEEWAAAADILDEAVTQVAPTDHRQGPLQFGPTHAEAYLGLGRVAEAVRFNDEHLALAREAGARHFEALALRVQGQIRAAQGLPDEAEASFAAAIEMLEANGARLELGRAFYHRARLRHDLGRDDDARADVTRARDLFDQCGAPRDLRRAEQVLEQLASDGKAACSE
ncbi:MAG: AAA family ATPase [Anaerolineae bacterium]